MEKIKLLMVDDNINLVEMVKEYFKEHELIEVVYSANDGLEGIELIGVSNVKEALDAIH